MKISLERYGVRIERNEEHGGVSFAYLSLSKFKQILLNDQTWDTGLLPSGTVCYKFQEGCHSIIIYRPSVVRELKYDYYDQTEDGRSIHNVLKKNAAIPHTIWKFIVTNNMRVNVSNVWALKDSIITHDTELFRYPFSNVNNGGGICWGAAAHFLQKAMPNLAALSGLPEVFYNAPFNGDWDDKMHGMTTKEYISGTAEYPEFDIKFLKKDGRKFKEIWGTDDDE